MLNYYVVTVGESQYLVEATTKLEAQKIAIDSRCDVRKASASDVVKIGIDKIFTARDLTNG